MMDGFRDIIPTCLLREHSCLAVYCYLLRSISTQPQRVIRSGEVFPLSPHECSDSAADIAHAIGSSISEVQQKLTILADLALVKLDSNRNTVIVNVEGSGEIGGGFERRSMEQRDPGQPVKEFSRDYLEYVRTNFSKKTLENAQRVMRWFCEFAGDKRLSALTPEDLEKYKASRKESVGLATINIEIRTIKAAMEIAVSWQRIAKNPFASVKQIRVNQQGIKHLAPEEFERLFEVIEESWFKDLVIVAALTGLRRGELANLRWNDFDPVRNTLIVQSSAEYRVKGGKMRTIALHARVLAILSRMQRRSEWIFCDQKGEPFRGEYVGKKFKRYIRAACLPEGLHFHSLRHSFGTLAANAGVPVNVIKQTMGHSSIKVTEGYIGVDGNVAAAELQKVRLPGMGA